MCGRFTLATRPQQIADEFPLFDLPELAPRYNIAPTQTVAVARILPEGPKREIALLRWGLVPSWAADPSVGTRMINARAETAATKPAFRAAYRKRRCLVLADGFYEWQKVGKKKQPYRFCIKEHELFAFAGLWEHWEREGKALETCSILTTTANDLVRPCHERMPVILPRTEYERWLDPANQTGPDLDALLRPLPADLMTAYPVSPVVNNARHDAPDCVTPLEATAAELF
jgi:putative SOS response-associated peptidase YedK